jgi:hypothetical protein
MTDEINKEESVDIFANIGASFIGFYTPCSEILLQRTTPVIAMVFGKIWLLSRTTGYCYMSRKSIAKQLGINIRTLDETIEILEGKPIVGTGTHQKPNRYFNETTRWIVDVTPDEFLSKKQVRHYAPIPNNVAQYVLKYEIKENNKSSLTDEQIARIHEKIAIANNGSNPKINGFEPKNNGSNPKINGSNPKINGSNPEKNGSNPEKSGSGRYKEINNKLPENTTPNKRSEEIKNKQITIKNENSKSIEFSFETDSQVDLKTTDEDEDNWGLPESLKLTKGSDLEIVNTSDYINEN